VSEERPRNRKRALHFLEVSISPPVLIAVVTLLEALVEVEAGFLRITVTSSHESIF